MTTRREYRDAAWLLFGLGGYREIGSVASSDGRRRSAIVVRPNGEWDKGTTQYLIDINWPLLEKLAKEEARMELNESEGGNE